MANRCSVLIVDDHEVVRVGLRAIVTADARLRVVGEAPNGEVASTEAGRLKPEIVVMDLSMPGITGAEATCRVLAASPASRVVVLTAHEEGAYVRAALRAGARAYVLKRSVLRDLVRAIHAVADGAIFVDPGLVGVSQRTTPSAVPWSAQELSDREVQVASLVASGYSNAEVASQLHIAVKTVETHKTHLMEKLSFRTRAQLVRYALYRGWLKA